MGTDKEKAGHEQTILREGNMDDASRYQQDFDLIMQELEAKASRTEKMEREVAEKFCSKFVDDLKISVERRAAVRKRCIEMFWSD